MPSASEVTNSESEATPTAAGVSEGEGASALEAGQQVAEAPASPASNGHLGSHVSFWDQLMLVAGDKKINSLADLINSTAEVEHMIEYREGSR